ncbi:hypothetical protein BJY01DRAFT_212102 [Aspergillus pseudoustus]|uniref:Uncharacterized protein n=1 Tax=Aspergillus pseudoustus TaxID=1810923 RepID=A0ABR4K761_9EURO
MSQKKMIYLIWCPLLSSENRAMDLKRFDVMPQAAKRRRLGSCDNWRLRPLGLGWVGGWREGWTRDKAELSRTAEISS